MWIIQTLSSSSHAMFTFCLSPNDCYFLKADKNSLSMVPLTVVET